MSQQNRQELTTVLNSFYDIGLTIPTKRNSSNSFSSFVNYFILFLYPIFLLSQIGIETLNVKRFVTLVTATVLGLDYRFFEDFGLK